MAEVVKVVVSGGRGLGYLASVRYTGQYGVQPGDSDAVAIAKVADSTLAIAGGAANYRATFAQALADFSIGTFFSTAETGELRLYQRVAGAPGYQDQGDRAAPFTKARKGSELASFADQGAIDDDVTDNLPAFAAALAAHPSATTLRLPRQGLGTYRMSGFDNTDVLAGYTIENHDGLVIRCVAPQWMSQPGMRVTRTITFQMSEPDCQFVYGAAANRKPVEKERFLDHGSTDWRRTHNIDIATEAVFWASYPNQALQIGSAPTASAADFVEINMGNGLHRSATVLCLPGEEVHAQVGAATTAPIGVLVVTKDGFVMTYQPQGTGQAITVYNSVDGSTTGAVYVGYGQHSSYAVEKSVLGIRVLTPRSFQILHNGYPVATVRDTKSDILEVGFGAGVNDLSGSLRLNNWTRVTGKRLANLEPIRAIFIGDSKTDRKVLAHQDMFFREAMETAGGCRIIEIQNLAVSGQNTAQQRATVQAFARLSEMTTAHIDIGTNDVQGNVPLATSLAEFNALLDLLADKWVTVAIPSLWYTQAQTPDGDKGGASTRYDQGAALRQAYRRAAASRPNVKVFDYDEMGPIVSDWLNGYPALTMDPMVFDNLHPTFVGRRLMGYAHAKALLGLMSPEPLKTYPRAPFAASWFAAGHGKVSDATAPCYAISDMGRVSLGGSIKLPAELPASGTIAAVLPRLLRPEADRALICPCYDAGGVYVGSVPLRAGSDGTIRNQAAYPASTQSVSIDGLL